MKPDWLLKEWIEICKNKGLQIDKLPKWSKTILYFLWQKCTKMSINFDVRKPHQVQVEISVIWLDSYSQVFNECIYPPVKELVFDAVGDTCLLHKRKILTAKSERICPCSGEKRAGKNHCCYWRRGNRTFDNLHEILFMKKVFSKLEILNLSEMSFLNLRDVISFVCIWFNSEYFV